MCSRATHTHMRAHTCTHTQARSPHIRTPHARTTHAFTPLGHTPARTHARVTRMRIRTYIGAPTRTPDPLNPAPPQPPPSHLTSSSAPRATCWRARTCCNTKCKHSATRAVEYRMQAHAHMRACTHTQPLHQSAAPPATCTVANHPPTRPVHPSHGPPFGGQGHAAAGS